MIGHQTDSCQLFDGDIGPSHVAFTSRTVLREEEGHGTSTPLIKMSLWSQIKQRQIVPQSDLSFELDREVDNEIIASIAARSLCMTKRDEEELRG